MMKFDAPEGCDAAVELASVGSEFHVIDGADELKVSIGESTKKITAKVVGRDEMTDIAEQPGDVVLSWSSWRAQTTLPWFVLIAGVALVAVLLSLAIVSGLWPGSVSKIQTIISPRI